MGRLAALEQTAGEQKHQDLRDKQQRQADAIELPGGEDPQALCGELDKSRLSHGALQVALVELRQEIVARALGRPATPTADLAVTAREGVTDPCGMEICESQP